MPIVLRAELALLTKRAVAHYWATLDQQSSKQRSGDADRGGRAAVTGGKQMDGFAHLVTELLIDNGMDSADIFTGRKLELPGYFRPTKKWDMIIMHHNTFVGAIEFKSHKGPSFGNNFNNRAEEAIGSAKDMWTAYREGAFKTSPKPWLGWVMMLEDCPGSINRVRVDEPHFHVFPEFKETSYAQRYELLARRLIREKLYDSTAFLMSSSKSGPRGIYTEPANDLCMKNLLANLAGHASTVIASD